MKRLLCIFGHSYTRYEYYEDSSLAENWGYLHCDRCEDDGYRNLNKHEYNQPE